MRVVDEINSDADVYQPVPPDDVAICETALSLDFPPELKAIFETPASCSPKALIYLLWPIAHPIGIVSVNERLRTREIEPFPQHLVAFASAGCGDYFAFDVRSGEIVYVDPSMSLEENLRATDLRFKDFSAWLKHQS